ncbi:MAG: DUF2999 family protein [Oligoflexus sp.]
MSEIATLIKELNIPQEKLQEFARRLQENPMSALGMVQELNIPPAVLQKIMGIMMTNPGAIESFAREMGFTDEQLQQMQNQMKNINSPGTPQKPQNND